MLQLSTWRCLTKSGASPIARAVLSNSTCCCAEVISEATSLMLSVALYRLFLADWYVVMMLLGPALGYTALACALAVPFAESLRRIQR